jgi:topoisomerase IA-like protein
MWLSPREYRGLLRQIARAERRATAAEQSLEIERHENRLAERHWSNQMLRKNGAYPQQGEKAEPAPRPPKVFEPVIDQGELQALQQEARRLGLDPKTAENVLREEKGMPLI